jgi:hypothetical protein
MADDRRVRYRGNFGRASSAVARRKMTRSDTPRPSNDALRMVFPITLSARQRGFPISGSWRLVWDTLRDHNSATKGQNLWREFALFCTAKRLATLG